HVTIAAIDEKSLARLGRWPWSRSTYPEIIERLDELGARVIVLDVVFPESENQQLLQHIERLEVQQGFSSAESPYASLKQQLAVDTTLGQAIAATDRVVLSMFFLMSPEEAGALSKTEAERALQDLRRDVVAVVGNSDTGSLNFPMPEPVGLHTNVPEIRTQARFSGHINSFPDADGTLRWASLVMRYRGHFFPSADVQAVRVFERSDDLALHANGNGITGLGIGQRLIITDEAGRALIHYYGPEKTIPTFSIADLLDGSVANKQIRDKIVVIGATAKGMGDTRVTPYGPTFPGVEIRATVMQNLLDGDFINRPAWMANVDIAVIALLGGLLAWVLPRMGYWGGTALTLALLASYVVVAIALLSVQLIWLNVVYPSVAILVVFVSSTISKYLTAETGKRQIKSAFQHYVAPRIVDEIVDNIGGLRLGGEKRILTVLFSDIRGFTSVSQSLAPEELVRLLNVYLTQMTEKVFKYEGLLDKYIGDGIMAVYGAPIYRDDHALLACRTALDMLQELRALQVQWREQGLPQLDIGIGMNTGTMVVGNMGSRDRFDYTVIGDAVNLGSRIEALNKIYGTHILLSEFTYEQVRHQFPHIREVDIAEIRGRQEAVRIFELMPVDDGVALDWLADFQRAYRCLRQARYAEALALFEQLSEDVGDSVSRHHMHYCRSQLSQAN
ncbi:MAG: adenylate/guanylate cyclase domain-containing protein, partial [Acidiferrobacterales bacterium]|nr:adenylate/guanylate cyclase domain-containing protein [Acidiferrobacterales bacterium]